jgi:hypothetical protein
VVGGTNSEGGAEEPSASLARLLRPFGIEPKQLWIEKGKVRGYDAVDFAGDGVAAYLERDGRDGRSGRPGSTTEAGSTVPTDPTDFSGGQCEDVPLPGDEGFDEQAGEGDSGGCEHLEQWRARDGVWRCRRCEPPAFPAEVIEERAVSNRSPVAPFPLLGGDGYPERLVAAAKGGHITEREFEEAIELHALVAHTRGAW